jgi:hypothetical protein
LRVANAEVLMFLQMRLVLFKQGRIPGDVELGKELTLPKLSPTRKLSIQIYGQQIFTCKLNNYSKNITLRYESLIFKIFPLKSASAHYFQSTT